MASGNWKVTFFFEGVQAAPIYASAALGWTETWYLGAAALTVDQVFSHPDVQRYVMLRRNTLPAAYRAAWIRVSDDINPRIFKVAAVAAGFGTILTTGLPNQGQVQCALLVDMARLPGAVVPAEPTHHRKFLMRGLPSDVINGNVINIDAASWPAIKAFLNFIGQHETGVAQAGIVATSLGIRYQDPSVTWSTITALQATGPGNLMALMQPQVPAPAPGVFPRYAMRRLPEPWTRFNRLWTFSANQVAPAVGTVFGKMKRALPSDIYTGPGPGQFRQFANLYGPLSQYTIIGLRSRKTGRLFRQLRGRSSNRP